MKLLKTESFDFTPELNSGEGLTLTMKFFDNGDGIPDGLYVEQELTLQSYGNSATFNLNEAFTPENLRELADQLELTIKSIYNNKQ